MLLKFQLLFVVLYGLLGALVFSWSDEGARSRQIALSLLVSAASATAVYFSLGYLRGSLATSVVIAQHSGALMLLIRSAWPDTRGLRLGAAAAFALALGLALCGIIVGVLVGR